MQITQPDAVTESLKAALRKQNITYRELAERIQVSEQTVKRLFREKDCSLSRLLEICRAIDVSVGDLLAVAQKQPEPKARLTQAQETFLANNKASFILLFFLVADYSLQDIESVYGLSQVQIYRMLRALEKQDFLTLYEGNRYSLNFNGRLLMHTNGPLKALIGEFNHLFLDYAIKYDGTRNVAFDSSIRHLTHQQLEELTLECKTLHEKYRKLGFQNTQWVDKEKLLSVKWTTMLGPFEILGHWPLDVEK